MRWRKFDKLESFLGPLEIAAQREDRRLMCGWIAGATESWRFASNTYPLGGGLNAQTIPAPLRYVIEAPEGRVWLQPDLSQAEARYVAAKSGCRKLLEIFADPARNVHMEQAYDIYGEWVEKGSWKYTNAKRIVHGRNYRMGVRRLAQQCGVKESEAQRLLNRARMPYPEVERWHQEVKQIARKMGRLRNCWGRVRECWGASGALVAIGTIPDDLWKELIAWEPQSAIPEITYRAMAELREMDEGGELWYHAHGHDSFLASVSWGRLDVWAERTKQVLNGMVEIVGGRELRIPADVQVGRTLGQMVKWAPGWQEKVQGMPPPEEIDSSEVIDEVLASLALAGEEGVEAEEKFSSEL